MADWTPARYLGFDNWHQANSALRLAKDLLATASAKADMAGNGFVAPNWLPIILVVAGIIVLAMLAYSILGWTGMR